MIFIKWFIVLPVFLLVVIAEWLISDHYHGDVQGRLAVMAIPLAVLAVFVIFIMRIPNWRLWFFVFKM